MSIDIKNASAEGFTMNYFSFGNGNKTFVILPGLSVQSVMGAAELIAESYKLLTDEFTIYVFDRRNELPEKYSVNDMASDTAKIFEILGLKNIYLFGASQGGMMSILIAAEHPELIKKLMLGSSAARITDEQYKNIAKWRDLAVKKDRVNLNLEMCKLLYPQDLFEKFKDVFISTANSFTDIDLERFIKFSDGTKGYNAVNELTKISCPILALNADNDKVLPGAGEEIENLLKNKEDFESHTYTGLGHAAFDTAPDYKERLLKFSLS